MPDNLSIILASMAIGQAVLALTLIAIQPHLRKWLWSLALFLGALIIVELGMPLSALNPNIAAHYWVFSLIPLCLVCPALWFYVVTLTSQNRKNLSVKDWKHALPALFAAAVFTGYMCLPPGARESLTYDGPPAPFNLEALITISLLLLAIIWIGQVLIYVFFCLHRLAKHRRKLRDQFANLSGRELWWIVWLAAALFIYAVFVVFYVMIGDENTLANQIDGAFTLIITSLVTVLGLRQRPIFQPREAAAHTAEPKKYTKSALTPEMSDRIAKNIETVMQDGLYKDPNLSLDMLAKAARAAPNYVSQTLNETLETTFFDHINSWRAKHVARQIDDRQQTITQLIYEAGFNSRSAFYRAFKKETGQTPGEYRKAAASSKINT